MTLIPDFAKKSIILVVFHIIIVLHQKGMKCQKLILRFTCMSDKNKQETTTDIDILENNSVTNGTKQNMNVFCLPLI